MYTPTHMQRYVDYGLERSNISGGSALKAKPTQTLALTNAFQSRRSAVAHAIMTQCNLLVFCRVCAIIFKNIKLDQTKMMHRCHTSLT